MAQTLSHTAVNVPKGALLESVGMVTRPLVLMIVLCQVTFPVEKVTGVAFMNAAKTNFRILPMYPANVFFADGHRKKYLSFAWLMCHAIMVTWHGTISCCWNLRLHPRMWSVFLPFIIIPILFFSSSRRLATISSFHDVKTFYSPADFIVCPTSVLVSKHWGIHCSTLLTCRRRS